MVWLAVAVVALATTAVLVYFFVVRPRGFARLGRLPVPGDEVVELPAGTHRVYYEDSFRWRYSEVPRPWEGFSMLISEEESDRRIDLGPAPDQSTIKSGGRNRIPYATIELPAAGRYRVTTRVGAGASDPYVTFG